jgi:transposase InsO family protein
MPGQRRQRDAERDARLAAVAYAESLRAQGLTVNETSSLLGATSRTVRRWIDLAGKHALNAKQIGRPAKRGSPQARRALLSDLFARPRAGVPTLRERHPELGRRELEELSRRVRSLRTTRKRDLIDSLTWTRPGSVWAIDFSDAGLDIEGTFPHLLLVRDLATNYELLALPCRTADASTVRRALAALISREGAPLVIKSDNGGPFIAAIIAELLVAHEVLLLRSPSYTPEYNGACEAGGGSVKTRAHHIAAANGRESCWSADDVAAALLEANETTRPWGPRGPTPGMAWRQRSPLEPNLRACLHTDVARRVADELAVRGLCLGAIIDDKTTQQVAREAIAGSLRALSLVSSRTISIPARRGPRRTDRRRDKPEGATSSS